MNNQVKKQIQGDNKGQTALESQSEYPRRKFLKVVGGGMLGVAIMPLAGCEFNSVEPIASGEKVSFLTKNEDFFYKNGAEISIPNWQEPVITRESWRLSINGLVNKPLEITYADIEAAADKQIEVLKTMRCVIDSNEVRGLIGTAVWRGVPLRIFLERAEIDLDSTLRLRFQGADGFRNNVKIDRVFNPTGLQLIDPILVTHMNGLPLPAKHGAPVRLIINEAFGYKNVKWITSVEATSNDDPYGTYQDADFVDDGVMRVNSRTTDPLQNSKIPPGPVVVSGFAVSGAGGIENVEVSVNGADWVAVELVSQTDLIASDPMIKNVVQVLEPQKFAFPYRGVWRTWTFKLDVTPGKYDLRIRAKDSAGNEQPLTDENGISDGINGIGRLGFSVG